MRLHATRFVQKVTGLLALLLVCVTVLPPTLHGKMDDLACEFGAGSGTGGQTLEARDAEGQLAHCEVCHWLQSVRVGCIVERRLPQPNAIATNVALARRPPVTTPSVPRRPSRAPPLT